MAVNKDFDKEILTKQRELVGDQAANQSKIYQQITDKITTISESKVNRVETKMPQIWVPLLITIFIMCAMGTVLSFNGGKFWLMLVLSIGILLAEYAIYTVWHKTRLEKTYNELLQIKSKVETIQKKFTPEYKTFNDKIVDLIDKIDGFVQPDSDGHDDYRILKSERGDLLIRDIYDKGGFRHYQLVYAITGELTQVREFSISRAGYLLTTYKNGKIVQRLFCGESGEVFSLEKYSDFYSVPSKVEQVRKKYDNIISAKLKQVEKIKDGAPTGTYNWFNYQKVSDSKAIDTLQQAEYVGRKRKGKKESKQDQISHDLSMNNLTGIDLINSTFAAYNNEVNDLYSKIAVLRQPDSAIYKKIADLQWYLRPVEIFKGNSKQDAYKKLSAMLAETAGEAEAIEKLKGDSTVQILNNVTLPTKNGDYIQIAHIAITPAGIFLIEVQSRDIEEGRIYRAKSELDKAKIRNQIALHKDAVYQKLKLETRGLFADHLVEKLLRADAIRSLLVIVNRTNPEKQDFLIDNPNYYRDYNRTLIVNPAELNHAVHRDTANMELDEQGIERITRALESNAIVYEKAHDNYEFFPYLDQYSGAELSQNIWNQLHSIEELEKVIAELNNAVNELIEFEQQFQKYNSLSSILPYFMSRLTDAEIQLSGEIGLNVEHLATIIQDEDKLLKENEQTINSLALSYNDGDKTLQTLEEGKLDAVVPIAIAVVVSTLLGITIL
ncbi:nuclease-related domain-containing protein [Lactobacillus sp. LL6]|uniref:nuclease-related domain-containing protein n=1 Tax=Lactobacillus sp. LL6 TaxID=2596827 RepID=UPI001184DA7B|nr:nuclease-related domain-containing protein [Lactobacillus sp. LL6]TSO26850.1 NERD domain-containing protein [Lactobacillus sp. LL6]